jgi:protein-disulfide isomerase
MSKKQQRGRQVTAPAPTNSLTIFYVAVGIIAVVGVVLIFAMASGGTPAESDSATNTTSVPTPAIAADATTAPTEATANEDSPDESTDTDNPTDAPDTSDPVTTDTGIPVGTTVDGFYYLGQPDAPVTVVEYSDFECPACSFHAQNIKPGLTRDYLEPGKVRLIFHDFPLNIHPKAPKASEATRCAGEQGKFWEMHDILFRQQDEWSNAAEPTVSLYPVYAEQIGVNRAEFVACLESNKYSADIALAYDTSRQVGISATPTFVVDGKKVEKGDLFQEIDAALAAKGVN